MMATGKLEKAGFGFKGAIKIFEASTGAPPEGVGQFILKG
jgi:hypothetical protein